jgi:hypothetical protein
MQHETKTTNNRPNLQGLRALQPNGSPIVSNTKCEMNESRLPIGATTGHKSPHVKQNIISLGVLCDHDCDIKLTKKSIQVTKNGHEVMTGYHNKKSRLWKLKIDTHTPPNKAFDDIILEHIRNDGNAHRVNAIVPDGNMQDMMTFYHRSLFSPSQSTLLNDIANNNLSTMEGLTTANVKKYLPKSIPTALGYLDQKQKTSSRPKTK